MKRLACRDVGVDCDVVFEAETEEEVVELAKKHGAEKHNLDPVPPRVIEKCKECVQDV